MTGEEGGGWKRLVKEREGVGGLNQGVTPWFKWIRNIKTVNAYAM